jgi:hypothetical protein
LRLKGVLTRPKQSARGEPVCITTKIDRNFTAIRLAEEPKSGSPVERQQHKLKELVERLDQFHNFTKGQIVKWKPGLRNRKFPDYGEPAIVTAVLPGAICDPSEVAAGSPYFQEPLTFVLRNV